MNLPVSKQQGDGYFHATAGFTWFPRARVSPGNLTVVPESASLLTPHVSASGIYRVRDNVAKALAMGARAVGVGRPYTYGLALGGAEGAAWVLRSILAEADLLMAVNGYPTLVDVRSAGVQRTDR